GRATARTAAWLIRWTRPRPRFAKPGMPTRHLKALSDALADRMKSFNNGWLRQRGYGPWRSDNLDEAMAALRRAWDGRGQSAFLRKSRQEMLGPITCADDPTRKWNVHRSSRGYPCAVVLLFRI